MLRNTGAQNDKALYAYCLWWSESTYFEIKFNAQHARILKYFVLVLNLLQKFKNYFWLTLNMLPHFNNFWQPKFQNYKYFCLWEISNAYEIHISSVWDPEEVSNQFTLRFYLALYSTVLLVTLVIISSLFLFTCTCSTQVPLSTEL